MKTRLLLQVKGILGEAMPTHSQVYYNNLLSLPFVCILAVVFGEPQRLSSDASFSSPSFHTIVGLSCIASFIISYSTLWFLSTTTPTTYGLVGSLNKIPVAVIGMVLFKTAYSTANIASIAVGLLAGVLFVKAKQI
jgi:GDP-mannose transporter